MALTFPAGPTPGQVYTAPNGIEYTWNNTLGVWEGSAGGPVPTAASLAEAAAGTINTKFSSPQTAVPKDTAGMGGAALLPSGGNYAGTTTGMFRFNTTSNHVEFYDGSAWQTSVNRGGDQMSGGIDFGPGPSLISSGATYGTSWGGIGSGNIPGGVMGYQNGQYLAMSRGGSSPLGLNRTDGIGSFIDLFDANVFCGFIGKNAVNWFCYQIDTAPVIIQSTSNEVYIQGNNAGGPITFRDGGGNPIAFISNAGVFTTISDASLKVDIEPLSYGLAEVEQLEPKSYKLKTQVEDDHGDAPTQLGLLAQEVAPIIPEVVDYREDSEGNTICSIAYTELVPVLINAIKELKAEFDEYKASHP